MSSNGNKNYQFTSNGMKYFMWQVGTGQLINVIRSDNPNCIGTLTLNEVHGKHEPELAVLCDHAILQSLPAPVLETTSQPQSNRSLILPDSVSVPQAMPTWTKRVSDFCGEELDEDWLVDGIIQRGTVGMIYGEPKCGKSHIALSLAMAIACPKINNWFERPAQHGKVFYLAGEGFPGLKKRIRAAAQANGIALSEFDDLIISTRGQILDADDWSGVEAIKNELALYKDFTPDMIIIDTLKKAMLGEENSAKDMGAMLLRCRALIQAYGCHIFLVHHAGKSQESKTKSRGSSALDGDVDFSFLCEKLGNGTIRLTQQLAKDEGDFPPMLFKLNQVELGKTKTGRPITTAVLMQVENIDSGPTSKFFLSDEQAEICDVLKSLLSTHGRVDNGIIYIPIEEFKAGFAKHRREDDRVSHDSDSIRRAFDRTVKGLIGVGILIKEKFNQGKGTRVYFSPDYSNEPNMKSFLESTREARSIGEDTTQTIPF